jgi:hypothetical protein
VSVPADSDLLSNSSRRESGPATTTGSTVAGALEPSIAPDGCAEPLVFREWPIVNLPRSASTRRRIERIDVRRNMLLPHLVPQLVENVRTSLLDPGARSHSQDLKVRHKIARLGADFE